MAESNLNEIINTSLQRIKDLAKNETVIGDPISLPGGVTIIPVSKISMGFVSGGLDFPSKKNSDAPVATKFGGGGGTGITVTPVAFLTVSATGTVELLPITNPGEADTLDKVTALIEKTPDVILKLKNIITDAIDAKKKKEETAN